MFRIFIFIVLLSQFIFAQIEESCEDCHTDTQSNCGLSCQSCHLDPTANFRPTNGHNPIIINPSDEKWWDKKCISCHQSEIEKFRYSLHYSSAGIINQTRFLWGKDSSLKGSVNQDAWKELAETGKIQDRTPAGLVDNLLAKKCLVCHFAADNRTGAVGMKRASGCAACHSVLNQKTGRAKFGHRFQKRPLDSICLTCHTSNYVGADYHGYFEHDYHNEYNTPAFAEPRFGTFQHRLKPDIHQQAGMLCIDCHSSAHVMENHKPVGFEGDHPQITCQDCHGGFNHQESTHDLDKRFDPDNISHKSFHKNVSCSACHSAWTYQDYGLHLFLDESNHYQMWEDYLWQGDQQVTDLLKEQLAIPVQARDSALSRNALTGQKSPGIWYKAWDFRRWEDPVLGIDENGFYQIIRPLYQYQVTYVDSADNVWLDSEIPVRGDGRRGWAWDVYKPHTISARGRNCESCHGNLKAVGMGIRQHIADSVAHPVTIPNDPIIPGTRLLNSAEQKTLLEKSNSYKKWRARAYREQGIESFLHK